MTTMRRLAFFASTTRAKVTQEFIDELITWPYAAHRTKNRLYKAANGYNRSLRISPGDLIHWTEKIGRETIMTVFSVLRRFDNMFFRYIDAGRVFN